MLAKSSIIWKRLGWMVLIWAASVTSLGIVAFLLRLVLKTEG